MKTIKKNLIGIILFTIIAAFQLPVQAQVSLNTYYAIDWQFNIPVGNSFAKDASGWGMNFEGGYYVMNDLAVGAFISYHTNNEYFSRKTLSLSSSSNINTDQQHSVFQLPFGLLAHYRFQEANFQPYVSMKLGAEYAQYSSYYYIFETDENTWGFYMSPEVGFNYYPWPNSFGFHFAIYYSFSTNKYDLMSYDGSTINNIGFRVGLAF